MKQKPEPMFLPGTLSFCAEACDTAGLVLVGALVSALVSVLVSLADVLDVVGFEVDEAEPMLMLINEAAAADCCRCSSAAAAAFDCC